MARARTLRDDLAARIARGGGLIGIGVFRSDLLVPVPEEDRLSSHQLATCDDTIAHWRHYARVAGEAAIVLGSDLSSPIVRPKAGGRCPRGIRNAFDLPQLFEALIAAGVPPQQLDRSGDRLLQFLRAVEAKSDPAAREKAKKTKVVRDDRFDVPM
jgi:membrane dipeptidase